MRLVISLDESEVKLEDGFDSNILIKKNGRAEFGNRFDSGGISVWLIGKAYGVKSADDIKKWVTSFDPQ